MNKHYTNKINVLIFGGSGNIGKFFSSYLDNDENINIKYFEANILEVFDDKNTWLKYKNWANCVVNLAGRFSTSRRQSFISNFLIHKIIIDNLLNGTNIKYIYTSTGAVYGNTGPIPIDEKFPRKPVDYYGFYKYRTELYIDLKLNSKNCFILRIPSIYGDEFNVGVISKWNSTLYNSDVVFVNSVNVYRSFINIKHVLYFLRLAVIDESVNGVYNIAENFSFDIADLAARFAKYNNLSLDIFFDNNQLQSMCLSSKSLISNFNYPIYDNVEKYLFNL